MKHENCKHESVNGLLNYKPRMNKRDKFHGMWSMQPDPWKKSNKRFNKLWHERLTWSKITRLLLVVMVMVTMIMMMIIILESHCDYCGNHLPFCETEIVVVCCPWTTRKIFVETKKRKKGKVGRRMTTEMDQSWSILFSSRLDSARFRFILDNQFW
jgi:hypothetical protein